MPMAVIQISDFGLAKLMPEGQETYATVNVLGTFGYFDPEYTSVCLCYSVTSNCVFLSAPFENESRFNS